MCVPVSGFLYICLNVQQREKGKTEVFICGVSLRMVYFSATIYI